MRDAAFWKEKLANAEAVVRGLKNGAKEVYKPGKPPIADNFGPHDRWRHEYLVWKAQVHKYQTYLWWMKRIEFFKTRIEAMQTLPRGKRLLHFPVV